MHAQPIIQAPAATLQQLRIEFSEAVRAWDRHHEVAPHVADQPFDLAFIIALARSPEARGEQIVGLQFTEDSSALPGAIAEDACNRQLGVVVEDRPRYSAKELEADIVTLTEGLGALRRIGLHQASIAVRQIHREEVDLALLTRDHRERFAEVDLCVSGIVAQWHEHLAQPLRALVHVAPYDRDPAAVPVLIAEPLEDPLSGVVLLGRVTLILLQDPVDDPEESIQLGPRRWPAPPISWRHRERQHLRHRPRVDPKASRRFPLTDPLYINCSSYLCVQFHPLHPSAHLCRSLANGLLLPDFYSGATGLSGCFSEGFCLRCSHEGSGASLLLIYQRRPASSYRLKLLASGLISTLPRSARKHGSVFPRLVGSLD